MKIINAFKLPGIIRNMLVFMEDSEKKLDYHEKEINLIRADMHSTDRLNSSFTDKCTSIPFRNFNEKIIQEEGKYRIIKGSWVDDNGCDTFTNMECESARLISCLVALYRPVTILETGTHAGYSAAMMANTMIEFNIDGHIYTFDPFKVSHVFESYELRGKVTWINDLSFNYFEYSLPRVFDLILLDSDHTYDTLAKEVEIFEPMLREGGLMILHDTVVFKDLWPVVASLKNSKRFEVITLNTPRNWCRDDMNGSGITILKKIESSDLPLKVDDKFSRIEYISDYINGLDDRHKNVSQHSVFFKNNDLPKNQ